MSVSKKEGERERERGHGGREEGVRGARLGTSNVKWKRERGRNARKAPPRSCAAASRTPLRFASAPHELGCTEATASGATREAQPPFNHLLIQCGRGLTDGEQEDGRTGDERMRAGVACRRCTFSGNRTPPSPFSPHRARHSHVSDTSLTRLKIRGGESQAVFAHFTVTSRLACMRARACAWRSRPRRLPLSSPLLGRQTKRRGGRRCLRS